MAHRAAGSAALLLLLALVARAVAQPDPTCARGVAGKNLRGDQACCPKRCGECGGALCGSRSLSLSLPCCISSAASFGPCTTSGPPCGLPRDTGGDGGAGGDATCKNGIKGSNARGEVSCCPKKCGLCGGATCGAVSARVGALCCISSAATGGPCSASRGAPCRLPPEPTPPPPKADPQCSTGIRASNARGQDACCPKKCGLCGGATCGTVSARVGALCCISSAATRGSCKTRGPPCSMAGASTPTPKPTQAPPKQTPSPSGKSSIEGRWRTADASGPFYRRHEACAVMVNGLLVLVGGRGENVPVSIYNPKTAKWSRKNGAGNFQLHHFQCVAAEGKVWIISSWGGKFPRETNNPHVYIYDVAKDKWERKAGLPEPRRRGGGAAVLRGKIIYLLAGNRGGHGPHAQSLGWVDAYDIRNNKWLNPVWPPVPVARDHTAGALYRGRVCIVGGRDGGSSGFFNKVTKEAYCLDVKTRKWSRIADFPSPRAGLMVGTGCDGRIVAAGGEGNGQAYKRVDVFGDGKWTRAPNMKEARHGSGLAVSQCNGCAHFFIPSGSGSQGGSPELPTTEEWVPKGAPNKCSSY